MNEDVVCEHGTAMDVHCCNCHSGFLFDLQACVCTPPVMLTQVRFQIEDARKRFRAKCRAILKKSYEDADSLSAAIGDVSDYQAFDAWVRKLMQEIAVAALTNQKDAEPEGSSGEL